MRRNQPAARVAHLVNHIFLLVDASSSMIRLKDTTIRVFDNFVRHLAERSQENGQETRVTIYFFSSHGELQCVVWDMDVLRVPSIAGLYDPYGNTALIQAFLESVKDMRKIPQMYGDHSVVFFGFTDGEENDSARPRSWDVQDRLIRELKTTIASAPENETYGLFVPDALGVAEAKRFGFPADNITIWDPTSVKGVEQAGLRLREVADAYMMGRSQGVRGYSASSGTGLFKMRSFSGAEVVATLAPMARDTYVVFDVLCDTPIRKFVQAHGMTYVPRDGKGFYQLTKPVRVQSYKHVIVEYEGQLYTGGEARNLLGLPGQDVTVHPDPKPGMTVFFQSTSPNRKLIRGTRLVVMR